MQGVLAWESSKEGETGGCWSGGSVLQPLCPEHMVSRSVLVSQWTGELSGGAHSSLEMLDLSPGCLFNALNLVCHFSHLLKMCSQVT